VYVLYSHRHGQRVADVQNAVIIASPDSRFVDRWLESYQTYEEGSWAHHSVVVPWVCLSLLFTRW